MTGSGGGEVLEFIQQCLDNDTSVEDREVALTIDVTDDVIDQAVTERLGGRRVRHERYSSPNAAVGRRPAVRLTNRRGATTTTVG